MNQIDVRIERSATLFAAAALLNATGYNAENGWRYSPVREATRVALAGRAAAWRELLEEAGLLDALQRAGGAMMMDWVPLLGSPPSFQRSNAMQPYLTGWQRGSWTALDGIEEWIRRFHKEERIARLWNNAELEYAAIAQRLDAARPLLQNLAGRIEGSSADPTGFVIYLYPNLLDAIGRGYSVSNPEATWLFVGPVQDETHARLLMTHELIHRWADPLAEQTAASIATDPMPLARARYRIVADAYPELSIWIAEIAVRAFCIWLEDRETNASSDRTASRIEQEERTGFLGLGGIHAALARDPQRPFHEQLGTAVRLAAQEVVCV